MHWDWRAPGQTQCVCTSDQESDGYKIACLCRLWLVCYCQEHFVEGARLAQLVVGGSITPNRPVFETLVLLLGTVTEYRRVIL